MHFRGITTLRELQESVVTHCGGQKANEWRNLRLKPLRLLLLTTFGSATPSVALHVPLAAWLG